MSISSDPSTPARIAELGATITGIVSAKDPPPAKWDTAELPALYVLTGGADYTHEGDDLRSDIRIYRIQVAVLSVGVANAYLRETRCRPLIVAVRDFFDARPSLGGLAGVSDVRVVRDSGVVILPEYDNLFIGFELQLRVVEYSQLVFAESE